MTLSSREKVVFKRTTLAALTALYFGAAGQAYAEAGFKPVEGTSLTVPTFTKEDVLKYNEQRQEMLESDLLNDFIGNVNVIRKHLTPAQIFQPQEGVSGKQTYIVQMNAQPVAVYNGDIEGFAATTAPTNRSLMAKGRVNVASADATKYSNFILNKQNSFISSVQNAGADVEVTKQFSIASNAMVVEMTQEDAILMSQQEGVKRITPNRIFELRTDRGPKNIGADKVWDGSVTPDSLPVKGEGMVVGIVDTGINTDHDAFASDEQFTAARGSNAGEYYGDCALEENEAYNLCNDKLIGVYSYPEITKVYSAKEFQSNPWRNDQIRPENGEDYNGHGSHTASTAAGNAIDTVALQTASGEAVSDGVDLPFIFPEGVSGVAPRAHVISYQVCWPGGGGDPYAGCPESAILSAFEDAITDGVDAINFSIGGSESFPWEDPMELAFLAAREAGISVAAAAGNSGAYWTADHTSPWVTTVGASTHDRELSAGDKMMLASDFTGPTHWSKPNRDIEGKGFTGEFTGNLVLAKHYDDPDAGDGYAVELCNAPFPAGTFTSDEIVVCKRGDIARVAKAENVAAGGAGGFILYNASYSESNVADNYVIPGIHIDASSGGKIVRWIDSTDWENNTYTAIIPAGVNTYTTDGVANSLAIFSSTGPARTTNTLVPDLTAPGVDIYAANADDQPFTAYPRSSDWTMMSGTSMAAPHVTGAMTLLTQMHPDWTPAEIQSALMMTAKPVSLHLGRGLYVPTFYHFMAGAGAIDVSLATQAGLVLDESIEGYKSANPNNGGIDNWTNIPSMVDMDCEKSCSFMRTVKATQDGSWNAAVLAEDSDVEITVMPSSFNLKAGETKDVLVKVTVPSIKELKTEPSEPGAPWEAVDGNYSIYNAMLTLTEVNNAAPEAHMPIVVTAVFNQLPFSKDFDIYADTGSIPFRVNTDNYSEFTPRNYGLVKADTETQNKLMTRPLMSDEYVTQDHWGFKTIVVPEGTKRLVVSASQATTEIGYENSNPSLIKFWPAVLIGLDKNNSGSFIPTEQDYADAVEEAGYEGYAWRKQFDGEAVCGSMSESQENICSIIDPVPGTYWIASPQMAKNPQTDLTTRVKSEMRWAVLGSDSDATNMTMSGPEAHDGNGDYNLEFSWDLPGSEKGEVYYGGFDLGNMPGAEGTLGFTALNIVHGGDTVSWSVDKDAARNMDIIDVTMKVLPNLEAGDRDFDLNVTIPEGFRLATGTISANHKYLEDIIVAENNSFKLSGTQLTTRNVERDYVVSTNLTSEQCHTPLIDEFSTGGYIDLQGEFGIQPQADWFVGDYKENFDVPIDWLFYMSGANFNIYNQENAGYLRLNPTGAHKFNNTYWSMRWHRGPGFLYEGLAPFWNGDFEMEYQRHFEDPKGLTLASQYAADRPDLGDLVFMEFDNVKDKYTGDIYDYEMILRNGMDYNEGMFEVIYAYDNLSANLKKGAVHLEGFDSNFSINAGPKEGFLYSFVGFDNLDEVLQDDLVICFDYQGPEQSEMEVSFKVVVAPEAVGSVHDFVFDYSIAGQPTESVTHSIEVKGNIKVAQLDDMTVAEDSRIDAIEVLHLDANNVDNILEVSGESVTAEVDGMMFNLIPDADFSGETEVFVTVRDMEHSGDAATVSFILTVTPTNDMPMAAVATAEMTIEEGQLVTLDATPSSDVDGDELTFSWEGPGEIADDSAAMTEVSGLAVGAHEFTLTVTDGIETVSATVMVTVNAKPAPVVEKKKDSGGSFGWMLLALPLLMVRRKKLH